MTNGRAGEAVRGVQTLLEAGAVSGLGDGPLLDRYVDRREPAVFELIVGRHGPMVWGVCRRVLRDHHDAEDAFQATFLVLARRAEAVVPRDKLGPWLRGVAHRSAVKARMARARRRTREVPVPDFPDRPAGPSPASDDRADRLTRAVSHLPDRYRLPVVLCDLGELTQAEAARRLGWPVGTVSGRLSRARALLARRLRRPDEEGDGVAPALVAATVRAAGLSLVGPGATAGRVSSEVAAITEGVLAMMFPSPLKRMVRGLLAVALLGAGAGVVAQQQRPGDPPRPTATNPPQAPSTNPAAVDDPLARAAGGRIVRAASLDRDAMILAYLPDWAHGDVDNLAIANNDGGVRTIVAWPPVPPEEAGAPDRRFLLALYSRKTTSKGPAGSVLAFELEDEWPERTSWKAQPGYAPEPAATFRFEPGDGWKLFDVTPLVRARAKAGRAGQGVVLRFLREDVRGGGAWSGYQMVSREATGEWADRRPRLLVVDGPADAR